MFTRSTDEKLTKDEAVKYLDKWAASEELKRLNVYNKYYELENIALAEKVADRADRNKKPNNFIPSAYYKTLVDAMSGYLFQNVQYIGDEQIIEVLDENNKEIKDMTMGTDALVYNRGVELLYTTGDETKTDIRFTRFDTKGTVLIYDDKIEPELFCVIRQYKGSDDGYDYRFDVIYKDEWQFYAVKKSVNKNIKEVVEIQEPKKLLFNEVPVVVYNTEVITEKASFSAVMGYIVALDWVLTGNANEIDRIVDALLVVGNKINKEDLDHMEEWKALQGIKKDDRAEFLTKDMSPQFREYVSKLLIQEIHKHSHIVDWYSPDSGMNGAVSAKALKTRLFDMDMFSQKIEKAYRIGAEKRIRLIESVLDLKGNDAGEVEIIFNRTMPSDFEDKVTALKDITFLSNQTKIEMLGIDWEQEKARLEEEMPSGTFDLIEEDEPVETL